MEAIIFVDRNGDELLPLTDNSCIALLPVAGKLVLEYTLEALVEAGIYQAHILVSAFAAEIREAFNSGERWGMKLTYSTSRNEYLPEKIIKTLDHPISMPLIMIRGDVLRSSDMVKTFISECKNSTLTHLYASDGLVSACMAYCKQDGLNNTNDCLSWPPNDLIKPTIKLDGKVNLLDSLANFHQANLDAVKGDLALRLPGKHTALGLIEGRGCKVYPQNVKQGFALIGSNCSTYPSVQFSGEVVIGDNVIIDRCATLENTVVLPNTYVGELVELRNAIVRGNDLIRIDMGSILKIRDAFLLADLTTTPLNHGLGSVYNRVLGIALFLLSFPLWLMAGLQLFLQKNKTPIIMQALRGNKVILDEFGMPQRAEFICSEFNLKIPILRYLPRLLAVISGDIRMVGVLPITQEIAQNRLSDWEKEVNQAPIGLIGPTQLMLAVDATPEEKLISDSYYWAHFDSKPDFYYIIVGLKTLFSRKAWLPINLEE